MSSELYRVRSHYDERNPVLQLSLGALSMACKLDGLLEDYAVPANEPALAPPEALLSAVLGLIALRSKLVEKLGAGARSGPVQAEQPRSATAGAIDAESLLR